MENNQNTENENIYETPLKNEFLAEMLPSPNNPPWNSWMALLAWGSSVLFIILLPNIALFSYLMKQHLNFSDQQQLVDFVKTDPTAVLISIGSIFPAHLLTFALAWIIITRFNKLSFFEMIGWKWGGFKLWHVLAIVVAFFALALVLTQVFGNPENDLTLILKSSKYAVYLVAILATFTAPLVEEVIYRGVLYSAFQRSFGVTWAVAIVTILFAVVHVPQYWGSAATLIMIGLLSLTLTMIRVKTNNLLPCIVLHTVLNGIQGVGMVAETFVKDSPAKVADPAMFILHLFR